MTLRSLAGLGLWLLAARASTHTPPAGEATALSLRPAARGTLAPSASGAPDGARSLTDSAPDQDPPRQVTFDFNRPGLPIPHWAIEVHQDGTGQYHTLPAATTPAAEAARPIRVGAKTHRRLEAGFEKVSGGACQTHTKHLADTGTKKIAYRSANDTWVSCTFNYSDDKGLMDAVDAFQAIAETLQQGDELEHELRYDRLGLDAEINQLTKEVQAGEAIEIGNIAPVLQEIAQDERVILRVRRQSARLLQDAGVLSDSGAPPAPAAEESAPAAEESAPAAQESKPAAASPSGDPAAPPNER